MSIFHGSKESKRTMVFVKKKKRKLYSDWQKFIRAMSQVVLLAKSRKNDKSLKKKKEMARTDEPSNFALFLIVEAP